MTVVLASKVWEGREGSDGDQGVRNYTQVWRVQTNNKWDDAATVLSSVSAGVPYRGLIYSGDNAAYCTSVRARNEGSSPYWWTVSASFSTEREISDSPLDDTPEISWSTEQYQEPAVFDNASKGILNSAGDPFDPPLMRDVSRRVVQITYNASVVPTWLLSYQDAVNSTAILIDNFPVAVREAKLQRLTVSPVRERNDIQYRTVDAVIHLNKDTWRASVLDAGFREVDPDDPTKRRQITNDGDSLEPTVPALLDGSSSKITDPTVTSAVFLTFDIYPEVDFTVLPGIVAQ